MYILLEKGYDSSQFSELLYIFVYHALSIYAILNKLCAKFTHKIILCYKSLYIHIIHYINTLNVKGMLLIKILVDHLRNIDNMRIFQS